jgi:glutamyl-tRNA synthetase
MREEQRAKGLPQGYNRRHRFIVDDERARLEASGLPSVIRLAVPLEGKTVVNDLIRGDIEVENSTILDPVMIKSDGMPTYHFAVVVDDHLMQITHVIRGEEWIASAPLHKILYDAFGWQMPVLVHLPVILDPSGKGKMSKRKTVVGGKEYLALVHEFIEAGYLPEAMFNFLTNVGWNYDPEQEVFSRWQAIERFDVAGINPASAALPYSKLEWLNGVYIRALTPQELQQRLAPYLAKQLSMDEKELRKSERLAKLVTLVQERIKLLTEAWDKVDWAFVEASAIHYPDPSLLIGKGLDGASTTTILCAGIELLRSVQPFDAPTLESAFRAAAEASDIKFGAYFTPFRVAITGRTISPPLFESMEVIGRAECVARVRNALGALQGRIGEKV